MNLAEAIGLCITIPDMTIEIELSRCCGETLCGREIDEPTADELKAEVRAKYARAAEREPSGCCGTNAAFADERLASIEGYVRDADLGLGCGLPTELAALKPGERVLDLGSGAGIDAFIAATEVGPSGHVTGLDFTEAMIERARANASTLEATNVEFVLGDIEAMPLPDASYDVILSNCVLNLVPDKAAAARHMRRVLAPGGRFCVSDVVLDGELPERVRTSASAYTACVSGAMPLEAYLDVYRAAGFTDVEVSRSRRLDTEKDWMEGFGSPDEIDRFIASGGIASVTVVGRVPA